MSLGHGMTLIPVRMVMCMFVMMMVMSCAGFYRLISDLRLANIMKDSLRDALGAAETPASASSFFTPPTWRRRESAPAACMHA
jgi:hypothetical protein